MSDTIDINVYPTVETVTFEVTENLTTININQVTSTGAVTSVNGMTGDVTIDTFSGDYNDLTNKPDIPDTSGLVPYSGAVTDLDLSDAFHVRAGEIITCTNGIDKDMTLKSTNVIEGHTAEWQNKDYIGIADITDIPDISGLVPYTGATSDVDLDTHILNAKQLKVKGTGGNGYISLKHQLAGISASTSESSIGADVSGNPIWKNDGNTQQKLMLENASDITGATKTKITYDSKGRVTAGADATTADIADSTDKRYVTDAQLTSIGTISNKLSGYIYKNTTSVAVTGTTSETQVLQVTIPANTFSATDILKFEILAIKSGTAGTQSIKVKLSTSNTMPSGTTDQIAVTTPANTNLFTPFYRSMMPINGGNIYGYPFTTSQVSDLANSTTAISSKAFDVTVTQYLYVSITNTSSGDTSTLRSVKISNI